MKLASTGNTKPSIASVPSRSAFRGIGAVQSFDRTPLVKAGKHLLEIQAVKQVESAKDRIDFFIVEFKTLETTSSEMKAGEKCAWVAKISTTSLPNIKNFLKAVHECWSPELKAAVASADASGNPNEKEQAWSDVCHYIIGEENPTMGHKIRCNSTEIMTKGTPTDPPHPFTKNEFSAT